MQRFQAVELAGKTGWAVASRRELIAQPSVSAAPSEEREAALTLERGERKLQGLADGPKKGKPWGIGQSDSAERPAVTLRPSPKSRASFPAAAPEGTAGEKKKKKKKRRGGAAARRVKLARAKASAADPPADQTRERSASPMSFAARSPSRGSSRSQRSTSASSRANRSKTGGSCWCCCTNCGRGLMDDNPSIN